MYKYVYILYSEPTHLCRTPRDHRIINDQRIIKSLIFKDHSRGELSVAVVSLDKGPRAVPPLYNVYPLTFAHVCVHARIHMNFFSGSYIILGGPRRCVYKCTRALVLMWKATGSFTPSVDQNLAKIVIEKVYFALWILRKCNCSIFGRMKFFSRAWSPSFAREAEIKTSWTNNFS